jgi:hypothetical protein
MTTISRIDIPNLIKFLFVSAYSRYFKILSYAIFNMLGKVEKYMNVLVKKSEGKRSHGRWEDIIRMDVKEVK